MFRFLASTVIAGLAVLILGSTPVSAATACTDPSETCKASCNNATEATTSLCDPPVGGVCCKPIANLAPGEGGCPTVGDTCVEKGTSGAACPSPSTPTGDTCLQGNGICCRKPSTTTTTAPTQAPSGPIKLKDPLGGVGILGIVNRAVNTFLGVLGALALLVFIYAGVVYMTAGGAADRVKHAVDTMKYAMIGLALIIFSYAIILTFFRSFTGTA